MNVGGLIKFSLNDFPGRVAAVVFTQGCNFRCPFCHNGALIPPGEVHDDTIADEEVRAFLGNRKNQLDGVVLSGGEPTLQPDLVEFVRYVKSLGLAVKLDTNGGRPAVLAELLREGLLDYIAMDIKAPLPVYQRLAGVAVPVAALRDSITMIASSGVEHEFRTTVVETLLSPEDVAQIRATVPAGSKHRLQTFRPEHAFDPALREKAAAASRAG